jgi:hypothetical protein
MERLSDPPDDCGEISRIEVDFGIPVHLSVDQDRKFHDLLDEIVNSPWNQPAEGVHWVSGYGSRLKWSKVDARLLGLQFDTDAPEIGEPTYDHSIYHLETTAREFVSEQERDKVVKRRKLS